MLKLPLMRYAGLLSLLLLTFFFARAQDADSIVTRLPPGVFDMPHVNPKYIGKFNKPSNIRVILGTQGSGVEYGSVKNTSPGLNTDLYANSSNYIGAGLSYKLIDGDLYYYLPQTRIQRSEEQTLKQFKLAFSYAAQAFTVRAYFSNMSGAIVSGAGENYQSSPNISMVRVAVQSDYVFNHKRYSYRAANAMSAYQRKTAGSFLLRAEFFYRELGADSGLVPPDREKAMVFQRQTGLRILKAPGLQLIPGYGWNIVAFKGKLLVSPVVFAGPGFAYNFYKTTLGRYAYPNWEWSSQFLVSAGYNGARFYSSLTASLETGYIPLDPSYFSSTTLKAYVTAGYRFGYIEKFIPKSLL